MRQLLLTVSDAVYRILVLAYPAEFRQEYGGQIAQVFHESCAEEHRRRGLMGLIAVWWNVLLDWALTFPVEHAYVLWRDLGYGMRVLLAQPVFTLTAVTSLALAIGGTTAVFSLVNAVLLRPLPYREPERIVELNQNSRRSPYFAVSPANFLDWQRQNTVFTEMAAIADASLRLSGVAEPIRVRGKRVSHGFFQILGVQPVLGRAFVPDDDRPGTTVAVISDHLWKLQFNRDPNIVGAIIKLDGLAHTVIGVLPEDFRFFSDRSTPRDIDIWVSWPFDKDPPTDRDVSRLAVIARMRPGVTFEEVRSQMNTIDARLAKEHGNSWSLGITVTPIHQFWTLDDRDSLLMLLAAVSFVLLIGCLNVTNLLLARAKAREGEMSVRRALGASRGRLMRQLLTESALLAVLGGVAGVGCAFAGIRLLKALDPGNIPRLDESGVDPFVLLFAIAITLLAAMLFGVTPSLRASRSDEQALRHRGASPSRILLAVQVALSMILLIGAGLLLTSFIRMQQARLGFEPQNILTMRLPIERSRLAEVSATDSRGTKIWTIRPKFISYHEELLDRISQVPGVLRAAAANSVPVNAGGWGIGFDIEGEPPAPPQNRSGAYHLGVTTGYFSTFGIPIIRGREFRSEDQAGSPAVAIISESLARKHFSNREVVGEHLVFRDGNRDRQHPVQIVGIAGDVGQKDLRSSNDEVIYVPLVQRARTYIDWQIGFRESMIYAIRSSADPRVLVESIRRVIREFDPEMPVEDIRTMEERVIAAAGPLRPAAWLLGVFAAIALILALVGIYGMLIFYAQRRTKEIAIRMALGARPRNVLWMLIRAGMTPVTVGLVLGLAGALALSRVLASLLFGVTSNDPLVYTAIALLFVTASVAAIIAPARRTTLIDPMRTLRTE